MRPFNVEIVSYAASQENWQLDKKEKGWTDRRGTDVKIRKTI